MIITTSPNRVKAAGYWCFDGDTESNKLVKALNQDKPNGTPVYTLDSEIDMRDTLQYIGISSTLLALGVPRKRYLPQAEEVLDKYVGVLFTYLEAALTLRLKQPVSLGQERVRYDGVNNSERRRRLLDKWLKLKYATEEPGMLAICMAMVTLLSEYPVNIKAVHATKSVLSIPEYTEQLEHVENTKTYVELRDKLMELLDAQ